MKKVKVEKGEVRNAKIKDSEVEAVENDTKEISIRRL